MNKILIVSFCILFVINITNAQNERIRLYEDDTSYVELRVKNDTLAFIFLITEESEFGVLGKYSLKEDTFYFKETWYDILENFYGFSSFDPSLSKDSIEIYVHVFRTEFFKSFRPYAELLSDSFELIFEDKKYPMKISYDLNLMSARIGRPKNQCPSIKLFENQKEVFSKTFDISAKNKFLIRGNYLADTNFDVLNLKYYMPEMIHFKQQNYLLKVDGFSFKNEDKIKKN